MGTRNEVVKYCKTEYVDQNGELFNYEQVKELYYKVLDRQHSETKTKDGITWKKTLIIIQNNGIKEKQLALF